MEGDEVDTKLMNSSGWYVGVAWMYCCVWCVGGLGVEVIQMCCCVWCVGGLGTGIHITGTGAPDIELTLQPFPFLCGNSYVKH